MRLLRYAPVICIAATLVTLVLWAGQVRRHRLDDYMASYRQLVKDRATE